MQNDITISMILKYLLRRNEKPLFQSLVRQHYTKQKLRQKYLQPVQRKDKAIQVLSEAKNLQLPAYLDLIRLDKPVGTYLLLLPCLSSLSLSLPHHPVSELAPFSYNALLFSSGAFLMRSAGCIVNDIADRDFDSKVERTKNRPLASKQLTLTHALISLFGHLSLSLAILFQLNPTSIALGALSLLPVGIYPLMKRVTYFPQLFLGLTINWGALLGYVASKRMEVIQIEDLGITFDFSALSAADLKSMVPLYSGCVFWTLVYDTIYAHQDKEDDKKVGVKSTALLFGGTRESEMKDKLFLYGCAASSVVSLSMLGFVGDLTLVGPFGVSLGFISGHYLWQIATAELNNPENLAKRFKSNVWIGTALTLGILADRFFLT
eukprot:maker-scaffold_10-snap-gene-11.6-mRNA-1 protein AED:0.03 eAED:0.03 QI:53/1/1/1/1/1/3/101/377